MANQGMLAAVAMAAAMDGASEKKAVSPPDCSCNPDDPNYSPDCVCDMPDAKSEGDTVEKAVKAERSRVLGIAGAAFPGQEKLALALINSGANLGEAALALNADQKAKAGKHAAALDADEKQMSGLRSQPANGSEPATPANPLAGLTGEALWKAEFSNDAELRAEFGNNEKAYVSFRKAESEGRARILNKAVA